MLNKKQKYLQIALNSNLNAARLIINQLPLDERIIVEVGTPLIKSYGLEAIRKIKLWWRQRVFLSLPVSKNDYFGNKEISLFELVEELARGKEDILQENFIAEQRYNLKEKKFFNPYVVADLKCMDRGQREVEIAKKGGADAAVALGQAPIETLDFFISECEKNNLDSMIDMMNVGYPLEILRQLKKPPQVVILHRGVDEETFDSESEIPYHEITRIKNEYDIMVAVAGGDTFQEVQRAIFNDADIVIVWKSFYQSTSETAKLATEFLKEIK